jgi:hypothetical protein
MKRLQQEPHWCFAMKSHAVSGGLAIPQRGFVSVTPAETWEQGLISGNGTIGANVLSRPLDETIIFTHERMYLPTGDLAPPPDTASRLFEMRQLIDRGMYQEAHRKGFEISGRKDFRYPDPFVPAFDMRIETTASGDVRATADPGHLAFTSRFTRAYRGGIQSLDGVARVVAAGAEITAEGDTMIIRNADRVVALVRLEPIYEAGHSHLDAIRQAPDEIDPDYDRLLERHAAIHGKMFNRVRLDIAVVAGKTSIEGSGHDCSRRAELPKDRSVALEVELKEEDRHDTQK